MSGDQDTDEKLSRLLGKAEALHEAEVPKAVDDILRYLDQYPKVLLDFVGSIKEALESKNSEANAVESMKMMMRFLEFPEDKRPHYDDKPINYELKLYFAAHNGQATNSAYTEMRDRYSRVTFESAANKVAEGIINSHKEWKVLGNKTLGRLNT